MTLFDLLPVFGEGYEPDVHRENFERLREVLRPRTSSVQELGERLALVAGGQWLQGTVSATADSEFEHSLGRIPSVVFFSVALDTAGGPGVRGIAAGGISGGGGNDAPWTLTRVFVRATVAGTYGFLVV